MTKKPTKNQDGGSQVDPGESNSPPTLSPDTLATQSLLLDISAQLGSLKTDVKHLNDRFSEARAEMATSLQSHRDSTEKKLEGLEGTVGGIKTSLRVWAIVAGIVSVIFVVVVAQNLGPLIGFLDTLFNGPDN